jgi:hypothetical protein
VRDDNLLLPGSGDVLLCDWNWLMPTAPWVDVVGLLISVHGDGQDAEHIVQTHPLTRDVDPVAVDAYSPAWPASSPRSRPRRRGPAHRGCARTSAGTATPRSAGSRSA